MTVPMKKKADSDLGRFQNLTAQEYDSCGIIAAIEKDGKPKQKNMLDTISALVKMEHRSGFINGEGDGCGILTDIPRALWGQELSRLGISSSLAHEPHFSVAHLFITKQDKLSLKEIQRNIRSLLKQYGLAILAEKLDQVNNLILGPNGRADEPHFWQIAVASENTAGQPGKLFELSNEIEQRESVQVASFSSQTAVYKLMGTASLLPKYFYDLTHPDFKTFATIGHNRYSTNTLSNFFRVQPFSILGHNGEINTVRKLQDEAGMIGVPLAENGSDSQDLNRLLETLIHRYSFTLFEAIELVFPPILNEMKHLPVELQNLYTYFRQVWGPFAQGPAGIVSRFGNECAFSVDALGLRPLWMIENERAYYFSSEQGIISASDMVRDPKPLAPGETVGVCLHPNVKIVPHHELQQTVLKRVQKRGSLSGYHKYLSIPPQLYNKAGVNPEKDSTSDKMYSAFGWDREQIQMVEQMADTGADPIRSLGHDAPLAVLSKVRQNISDFIKESVAVVTNPAIDRERETEHFSTRVIIGSRPNLKTPETSKSPRIELPSPILAEGVMAREICNEFPTLSYESVLQMFENTGKLARFSLTYAKENGISKTLELLAGQVVKAVENGAVLILLDDSGCHQNGRLFLDPHLAVSKVDQALKKKEIADGTQNLRRRCNILIRSAALRNLHDLAVAAGLGADLLSPYLMFATISELENKSAYKLYQVLNKGLEKILSTIGIHELRGYARLFSAIGLHPEIADILQITNYCGSDNAGYSLRHLEEDAEARYADYSNEKAKASRLYHIWPRIWKSLGQLAAGSIKYEEFAEKIEKLEQENPVSLRHVTDLLLNKQTDILPEDVDSSVGTHDLPIVISSMSFGSQNEVAFRAYAEAADRLNIVSLNGEGGEIKDMLGKYPKTRGHQIASGRFGVSVELANSANILEIKIGQGAKPGEGGHLPGKKVTAKVAAARNASPGSDLISPSNNHDIYSIEDLAQTISELKTANKRAKVIVKVPIVPNIGTIAVGIAKAGADVITLSGFDGGTGAARVHALQHVGLPAEIGVKTAHNALVEAGIRNQVEIWADGGLKSAADVIKVMLLGANRVGFGTLAMLAIGCTTCRGCHLDTCHVGIATQIESVEEANEHGLRRFVPRQFDTAVASLINLFTNFGNEIKQLTAQLGFKRTQDLVGRSDLLMQTRELDKLDLCDLLQVTHDWVANQDMITKMPASTLAVTGKKAITFSLEQGGSYSFTGVDSSNRVLLSDCSGARVRQRLDGSYRKLPPVSFSFSDGSIPGNGFAAFHADGIQARVIGGAQDGVGKTAFGGKVSILKAGNRFGVRINGSVGKGFCYGAQAGLFIVQGDADSRAGIRLSGADLIIGGEIKEPLQDEVGFIANRANIKGFAFEYMTDGRAVVLGDPGPWICSGMTGGVVYLRLQPESGLDEGAIMRRIAKGAKVNLEPLNEKGIADLNELLGLYQDELLQSRQFAEAEKIEILLENPDRQFISIIPAKQQADPLITTE